MFCGVTRRGRNVSRESVGPFVGVANGVVVGGFVG
jgi:hypothetical protein